MIFRLAQYLFILFMLTRINISLAVTKSVELAPGEGTIILLGNTSDAVDVYRDYLSESALMPSGILDRLLLGFYTSPSDANDEAMALFSSLNATTVMGYRSYMGNNTAANFAAKANANGLLAICQPSDLYFVEPSPAWQTMENYRDFKLIPELESYAPAYVNDANIFAWQPREELPGDEKDPIKPDENNFTAYKSAFKSNLPNHLLYQLDSQQDNLSKMQYKQSPMPDISGLDRYPWWYRYDGGIDHLWTPDYALNWLYNVIEEYPSASKTVMDAPAIFVGQGCAELNWIDEQEGIDRGYQVVEGYRPPAAPNIRWEPELGKFSYWNRYLAPSNCWRCQNWLAICAGFKGIMFWSGGPGGSQVELDLAWQNCTTTRVRLIDENLNTLPYVDEISSSWEVLRNYEKLILDIHNSSISHDFTLQGNNVIANTFIDSAGREYIIIVNTRVGTWLDSNNQPTNPDPLNWQSDNDDLYVGYDGQLVNYTPATGTRSIFLTVNTQESENISLFDIRNLPIKCSSEESFHFTSDVNKDCYVDFYDFAMVMEDWLK